MIEEELEDFMLVAINVVNQYDNVSQQLYVPNKFRNSINELREYLVAFNYSPNNKLDPSADDIY